MRATAPPSSVHGSVRDRVIAEAPLTIVVTTAALFWLFGESWLAVGGGPAWTLLLTAWLLVVILLAAFAAVRHAEALAERLGEPLGTLVLTLSVTSIEVLMVSSMMLTGAAQPELARDTMYGVVMIVLNGLVGLCLLLGGLRHREQEYNLQGANAFLALILPLAVLTLILPRYTRTAPGPMLSSGQELFLMGSALGLYGVFLAVQTVRHRSYFTAHHGRAEPGRDGVPAEGEHEAGRLPTAAHALLLLAYLGPVVLLAEELGIPLERSVANAGAPAALTGMLVALLILAPEGVTALRASLANQLQRAVNVALGSAAATIGLTVPAVLAVSLWTREPILLGLDDDETVMLSLTLLVSVVTFSSGRTNVLQGAVHVVLFLAYVLLIFD